MLDRANRRLRRELGLLTSGDSDLPTLWRRIDRKGKRVAAQLRHGRTTQNPRIVSWMHDPVFQARYARALAHTGQPAPGDPLHRERSYVLTQLLRLIGPPSASVAECGVFAGMTAFQICEIVAEAASGSTPADVHLFDSFQGLSPLTDEDVDTPYEPAVRLGGWAEGRGGALACSRAQVQGNLAQFPFVSFHEGWVPACFNDATALEFAFVHIDVDLYQPTLDAARFFYPRLVVGGVLLFDDYGFSNWPGAHHAVEQFAAETGVRVLRLPTGQAAVFKVERYRSGPGVR